ncbi:ribosome recycling factor [Candidatus Xianfuyuplasma coldseepsis]|uniref:Ribosome-recycling factor n=1 Tax=Candidatus Xianfuyuplasma coldseepsis TaxID=2782163 RepID=A0A7L7KSR4_9MOLU|nr:ribosome recycling factor [Xianfuyuplasma coldseepsis]QMS85449.1 ribosome recycling factor [Xianfuyuplasma coldseepsis]
MPEMILMELEEKMEARIKNLSHELAKIRTGRANPRMFDDVHVPYYGVETPITQVANISVPEPTQLIVKPYDRSIVKDVEKAIMAANLGVNPNNEGVQLRIVLPALTKERRIELTKQVKKYGEEAKISIRNYRRDGNDAIKKLEKNHEISEDDSKGYQEDIQELTDKYTDKIDQVVQEKDEDIMSI